MTNNITGVSLVYPDVREYARVSCFDSFLPQVYAIDVYQRSFKSRRTLYTVSFCLLAQLYIKRMRTRTF